jgi:multidrug efflux pump subunit AcrB
MVKTSRGRRRPSGQALVVSLLFGLLSATVLTVLVIPAFYVVLRDDMPKAAAFDV